jgi:outer membrane protein TolC
MKCMLALLAAAFLLPPGGLAGQEVVDSLTVDQAIRRVVETHPAIQEAKNGVSASEARVQVRETALSPNVVAAGSYSRVGPVPSLEFNDQSFSLFPSNNYDADLTLRHTLWDGGRRQTAVEEARSLGESAMENVDFVTSRLAFQTVAAFYGVLFLEENLRVQDEEIDALSQHLEITQGRVRAGAATDLDVLSTQVRIATARSQRVDIADALEQRRIELRQLLGLPPDTTVEPAGGLPADSLQLDLDSLEAVALARRPDVRMARNAEASADVQTRLASLGDRPSVSLDLRVGAKNGYVPNLNRIKPNFVAGMAVQLPVYDGDRTRSQVMESEAHASAARSRTEALERNVAADVERAVAAVRAAREKIGLTDVQVRQATAALELARTRYQAGVVTNLDVLDAQTLLAQARLVQLRARYELVWGRYRLEEAVGERIW